LTTNSQDKAAALELATAGFRKGSVRISVIPNRGRDVGAFITGVGAKVAGQYDIIGHLHSKRSLFMRDDRIGERWREFILQHLVGGQHPMMDVIIGRMVNDQALGLVFPDDPHLSEWDADRAIGEEFAARMGIREPLPPFFSFPLGTMFWARSAALAPLFRLGLTWADYPEEPVPIDGTILHGLERLLPFVTQHSGYRIATTHVPGVTW
jgi:lipopolysaccharide biosynthesis protein